jgi:hypothetical protein
MIMSQVSGTPSTLKIIKSGQSQNYLNKLAVTENQWGKKCKEQESQ